MFVAALMAPSSGFAQQPKVTGIAAIISQQLDTLADQLLRKYEEPGLVVAMIDGCEPSFMRAFGFADKASSRRMEPSTMFQMGSISKTFTAWGVMRLVEARRIDLDAPVNRYLKRWHIGPDSTAEGVTVRRLLSHTAGISVPSVAGVDLGQRIPSLIDELEGRGSNPGTETVRIAIKPGTKYEYSGGGYAILQLLIEDVTGKSFAEYMQNDVLAPLGMKHTQYGWSPSVAAGVATPYNDRDRAAYPHRVFPALAAAGLYSNGDDMTAFVLAHCSRGSARPGRGVVAPSTLLEMFRRVDPTPAYGLGYEVMPSLGPIAIVGHSGSNWGWKTNVMLLPDLGVGIVVMTNTDGGRARTDILRLFRDAVLKIVAKPA